MLGASLMMNKVNPNETNKMYFISQTNIHFQVHLSQM